MPAPAACFGWEAIRVNGHNVSGGSGAVPLVPEVLVLGGAALIVVVRRDVT